MRHGVKTAKLGRRTSHRRALLLSLSKDLIRHGRLSTTLPRAKALRPFVEPILTLSKNKTLSHMRQAFSMFQDKALVRHLFDVWGPTVQKRSGGYVRIIKSGYRQGDSAPVAIIEMVDRDALKG